MQLARCLAGVVDRSHKMSIRTEDLAKAMVDNSLRKLEDKSETLEHADIMKILNGK